MNDKVGFTKQVDFWKGEFGDDYMNRNIDTEQQIKPKVAMWSKILQSTMTTPPRKFLEVGANIGLNIRALQRFHQAEYFAIEPNKVARQKLLDDNIVPSENIKDGIATNIPFNDRMFDFVYTSVVLIHIHPDHLLNACREIHRVSSRYILAIEYFSKTPQEVSYRGNDGYLFKRDFGKYWLENFPDLNVVDYGFFWEPVTQLDDYTWWLFEKKN
jgi:pseudaminic acid biosynthesis-associated methylase